VPHFPSKPRPTCVVTAPHFPSESVPYLARNPQLAENCGLTPATKPDAIDYRHERAWPGWWRRPFEDAETVRQRPDYGRIVCTCENVSRGEVIDALESALQPHTLDGVKRRTRALAGSCQGFGCLVPLVETISTHCRIPLESVTKKGPGSELLNP
jgi:hypothetical protein